MHMRRKQWLILIVILILLGTGLAFWFHGRMRYEIVEIPLPMGFENPFSLQLNDVGTVALIMVNIADKSEHIFYWNRDTGFKDRGNLGIEGTDISISDMNNADQIVGLYRVDEKLTEQAAQLGIKPRRDLKSYFFDPRQGLRDIAATPGRTKPWAIAINNHGQVVGVDFDLSNNQTQHWLFLWTLEGGTEDLKTPGFPQDINDSGHIVGEMFRPYNAFFWSRQTGQQSMDDPLAGKQVFMKMNNSDQVIGLYGPDHNQCRPFRWDPRQGFSNLGRQVSDLPGITDITDNGGYCFTIRRSWELPWKLGHGQEDFSIVTIPGRFKTNLNRLFNRQDLNFTAADMNNNGWILGVARDAQSNQFERLLLLIPKNYPKAK